MWVNKKSLGITLAELIATIVVIGVFLSAIISGSNLYNRAKLNAVIKDFQKYDYALNAFYQQYNHYPGDMPNATKIWNQSSNGDGNSMIGKDSIKEPESYLAFQHLSLAGLIHGSYTGSGTRGTKIGINTPRSPYRNRTTYWFYTENLWENHPTSLGLFLSGKELEGYSDHRINTPDAYYIDNKIDNGLPYTGKIIAFSIVDGDCAQAAPSLTKKVENLHKARYKFTDDDSLCSVFYNYKNDIF